MKRQISEPKAYYNNFQSRLIKDYLNYNPRVVSAIKEMVKRKPNDVKNVLDIGCGIGWSSYYLLQQYPEIKITAIDLSEKSIEVARKLFNSDNITYSSIDVTNSNFVFSEKFDYVIMLDVYEHIDIKSRGKFIDSLKAVSNEKCQYFFSCPTILHQNYLKKYVPEGLQPVDEYLSLKEMMHFADEIGGEVVYFENKSIWNSNDYFHCLIAKKINYESIIHVHNPFNYIESVKQRIIRVFSIDVIEYLEENEKKYYSGILKQNRLIDELRNITTPIKKLICR